MENNKTQAEIYREERKERLAKAAAKNAKKSPKNLKARKMAKKVIAIVLAVVIGLSAVIGILNFFDVPQKAVKISIDGVEGKVSLAEVNYYYFQTWLQFFNATMQYEQYGEGMGLAMTGFDASKTPDKQEYTEQSAQIAGIPLEDLGDIKNPTWEDAFTRNAISQLVYAKYGAMKAKEAGIKLTDAEIEEIDKQIEDIRETAKKNDFSLNRWLRMQIGSGVTEKVIRNLETENHLAATYYEKITNDTRDAITDDQINAEYAASKDDYDIADIRIYAFAADLGEDHSHEEGEDHEKEHAEAGKVTKEKADAFLKEVTDEESFIAAAKKAILSADNKSTKDPDKETLKEGASYASLTSSYGEDVAKWVYDDARKVGDTAVITSSNGNSFVVMLKTLPAKDTDASSNSVRHILMKYPDKNVDGTPTSEKDKDGKTVSKITKETKEVTKDRAQKILDEFQKNPTEANFIELAKKHTEDPGSKDNGGLINDVADNGQYVEAFTKWAVDASRKPGDTGIVETEYGYHVMYYVEANEENWYLTIQNTLVGKQIEEEVASVIEECVDSVNIDSFFINWTLKKENDLIAKMILSNLR